ncbi:hypothetical protein MVEN_00888000 [Mycena venus]|uniref:Uncharacterized protein n=1 Tax=Mycena venus TaxID=2733690 RepID=A0A8H6YG56_9AGAR|nr:hypothetical protein MVEN_00888000 [Mycena venus]
MHSVVGPCSLSSDSRSFLFTVFPPLTYSTVIKLILGLYLYPYIPLLIVELVGAHCTSVSVLLYPFTSWILFRHLLLDVPHTPRLLFSPPTLFAYALSHPSLPYSLLAYLSLRTSPISRYHPPTIIRFPYPFLILPPPPSLLPPPWFALLRVLCARSRPTSLTDEDNVPQHWQASPLRCTTVTYGTDGKMVDFESARPHRITRKPQVGAPEVMSPGVGVILTPAVPACAALPPDDRQNMEALASRSMENLDEVL